MLILWVHVFHNIYHICNVKLGSAYEKKKQKKTTTTQTQMRRARITNNAHENREREKVRQTTYENHYKSHALRAKEDSKPKMHRSQNSAKFREKYLIETKSSQMTQLRERECERCAIFCLDNQKWIPYVLMNNEFNIPSTYGFFIPPLPFFFHSWNILEGDFFFSSRSEFQSVSFMNHIIHWYNCWQIDNVRPCVRVDEGRSLIQMSVWLSLLVFVWMYHWNSHRVKPPEWWLFPS